MVYLSRSLNSILSSTSMAAVEALPVWLSLSRDLEELAGIEEDDLCDNAAKLIRHQFNPILHGVFWIADSARPPVRQPFKNIWI